MTKFHKRLVQIHKRLGYKQDADGLCKLYFEKALDAFLIGEYNLFYRRTHFLHKKHRSFVQLLEEAKDKAKHLSTADVQGLFETDKTFKQVLESAAFIDQGDLYMHPFNHSKIFNEKLYQHQSDKISFFAQSKTLEMLGGRSELLSFCGTYDLLQLCKFLIQLNQLALNFKKDFAIRFESINHVCGIFYNHHCKNWYYINVNNPNCKPFILLTNDELIRLALAIQRALGDKQSSQLTSTFETTIITIPQNRDGLYQNITVMTQTDKFQNLHSLSEKNLQHLMISGSNLAAILAKDEGYIDGLKELLSLRDESGNLISINLDLAFESASQNGNLQVIKLLMESEKINGFARINLNNPRILMLAAIAGQTEIIKFLIDAKNPVGDFIFDLNQVNGFGCNALYSAIDHKYFDIVKLLVDAKDNSGQPRVNLNNIRESNGRTLLYDAVLSKDINIVSCLINARTFDGRLRVNLNQPDKQGTPPIFLAAFLGQLEILKILLNVNIEFAEDKPNPLQTNCQGYIPFQAAVNGGHLECAKLLAQYATPEQIESALGDAIGHEYSEIIDFLKTLQSPMFVPKMGGSLS